MTSYVRRMRPVERARELVSRWVADLRGATLVQFVVVLPAFVLVAIGMWSLFTVYSAKQTLCEAVWEASRYLQVESHQFPDEWEYPKKWEEIAVEIINEELPSNQLTRLERLDIDDVTISPSIQRRRSKEMKEVTWENVEQDWFFIDARTTITNPLAVFVDGKADNGHLLVHCKVTGFFESPPIGPTPGVSGPSRPPNCPPIIPICSPGPPPTAPPPGSTPAPTPTCPPCRPR